MSESSPVLLPELNCYEETFIRGEYVVVHRAGFRVGQEEPVKK